MGHAPTSLTHWGAFSADVESGDIAAVTPLDGDDDPSPLLGNLPGSIRHPSRITCPAIRRGWPLLEFWRVASVSGIPSYR